mmetsp:Transcript_14832/g.41082  ORF Transcript_14832/g.41082 Transcript_14832/m.41082 type:complete len:381 (-) Transcript_14832:92-1234(-)|eukprot:CAMPEP_0198118096 /NCGR_PEP_ID=MMETSP1442-20131203/20345_1 /TAXON_ID= /ORGANISM="Craspedostauros australis, Strain CCMP3328" /LENGTH=380 /DNA_ID=CAMNT_0043776293 /DNA_START=373 /DNA_END=1515 /DNA_ORIENTATION=+
MMRPTGITASRVFTVLLSTAALAAAFVPSIHHRRQLAAPSIGEKNAFLVGHKDGGAPRFAMTSLFQLRSQVNASMDKQHQQQLVSHIPDPKTRQKSTKFEIEFRNLLEGILYTQEQIDAVPYSKVRTVVHGIAASYSEPAVYRAFEVLYEDHAPLRIAGRLVYSKMKQTVETSIEAHDAEMGRLRTAESIGVSLDELQASWRTFGDFAGGTQLGIKTFRSQMLPLLMEELHGIESGEICDAVFQGMKTVGFADLILRTQRLLLLSGASSPHSSATAMRHVIDFDRYASSKQGVDKKLQRIKKHNVRYDEMLTIFDGWKQYAPSGEGRRLDILRGCFVGAGNEHVVEALRVIYTEYSALRISGDWIFKIVSAIMKSTIKST